jgi:hypothetical protein
MDKITYSHPSDGSIFEVTRDPNVSGGWLQGYIGSSYTELVSVFGHPTYQSKEGKTKAEWDLIINGVAATIYDYKEYDKTLDRIREWHIGGTSKAAVRLVEGAIEAALSLRK